MFKKLFACGAVYLMANASLLAREPNASLDALFRSSDLVAEHVKDEADACSCPLGVAHVLATLQQIVDPSETLVHEELSRLLGFHLAPEELGLATYALKRILELATFAAVDDQTPVKTEGLSRFKKTETIIVPTSFKNPSAAADQINGLVGIVTHGVIPEIIQANQIDPNQTRLALLNAIFVQQKWIEKLSQGAMLFNGSGVQCFYDYERFFNCWVCNGATYLSIKANSGFSLLLKMLSDGQTMPITGQEVIDFYSKSKRLYLAVQVPAVSMKSTLDLKSLLTVVLGQTLSKKFLSILCPQNHLLDVSSFSQICDIRFDEEGFRAAAVTSMLLSSDGSCLKDPSVAKIVFNKPFSYAIVHEGKHKIFSGSVNTTNVMTKTNSRCFIDFKSIPDLTQALYDNPPEIRAYDFGDNGDEIFILDDDDIELED